MGKFYIILLPFLFSTFLPYITPVYGEDCANAPKVVSKRNAARPRRRPALSPGSFIERETKGKKICIINAQNKLTDSQIFSVVREVDLIFHFPIEIITAEGSNPQILAEKLYAERKDIGAAIIFIQAPNVPTLLLAPEEPWGSINVDKLYTSGGQDCLPIRSRKEFWRAFCYLMGAANSNYPGCVMKTVRSLEDLDALKTQVACPESFNKILGHTAKLGIRPRRIVPYSTAIREGWAPAPTNDVQRAIWKQVKGARPPGQTKR